MSKKRIHDESEDLYQPLNEEDDDDLQQIFEQVVEGQPQQQMVEQGVEGQPQQQMVEQVVEGQPQQQMVEQVVERQQHQQIVEQVEKGQPPEQVVEQNERQLEIGPIREQQADPNDKTIQDLPVEMVERVLVESVVAEVIGLKLVRQVWKDKAAIALERLKTVCQQWYEILSADSVLREIHKRLDEMPEPIPRLDILQQELISSSVVRIATLGPDILILPASTDQNYFLHVYDRTDLAHPRLIILLNAVPRDLAACSMSKCAYVLSEEIVDRRQFTSVYRIITDRNERNVERYLNELREDSSAISVNKDGHLHILSVDETDGNGILAIYDAEGHFLRQLVFPAKKFGLSFGDSVLHRRNRNFLLVSVTEDYRSFVTEADRDGSVVRSFETGLNSSLGTVFADRAERVILTTKHPDSFRLLDSEFSEMGIIRTQVNVGKLNLLHYSEEHDDIVAVYYGNTKQQSTIVVMRLADD